jgi:hypothetical protein
MGWANWRVPEITEEVEFRLKVQELEVRKLFKRDPQAVLRQALLLAREKAILERTVEKAGRRIMELDMAAALGPAGGRSEEGQAKPAWRRCLPWWCRWS